MSTVNIKDFEGGKIPDLGAAVNYELEERMSRFRELYPEGSSICTPEKAILYLLGPSIGNAAIHSVSKQESTTDKPDRIGLAADIKALQFLGWAHETVIGKRNYSFCFPSDNDFLSCTNDYFLQYLFKLLLERVDCVADPMIKLDDCIDQLSKANGSVGLIRYWVNGYEVEVSGNAFFCAATPNTQIGTLYNFNFLGKK